MGRSYIIPAVVFCNRGPNTATTMQVGSLGGKDRPAANEAGLREFAAALLQSMAVGGVNFAAFAGCPKPTRFKVVFQTGKRAGEEIVIDL
jgi:hypothetical protein